MRTTLILLLLAVGLSPTLAQTQKMDTITVSTDGTTYLIFDESISLFNLGSKSYIGKVENSKMLFLKALSPDAQPTTILIQFGTSIFTGYIRYARKLNRHFYDYRATASNIVASARPGVLSTSSTTFPPVSALANPKFAQIKKAPKNQKGLSETNDGVEVECTNLYNDKQLTYLKLAVHNKTTLAYQVDFISFSYKEKLPRKLRNKVAPQIEEVTPVDKVEPARIEAGRVAEYIYSLPMYSTTDDGYLELIFREAKGARVLVLQIPAKKIMAASLL